MVFETRIYTTAFGPVQKKKNFTTSKMIKKAFKVACKMCKISTHQTLALEQNRSISSTEDYQNWQNEQLEQSGL